MPKRNTKEPNKGNCEPPKQPTARQLAVLEFIRKSIQANHRPPTVSELRVLLGVQSNNGIRKHLESLQNLGYIKINKGGHRNIVLVENTKENIVSAGRAIPILGTIGKKPDEPNTSSGKTVTVDAILYPQPGLFALYAADNEYQDVNIVGGDMILILPGSAVNNNDLVIVNQYGKTQIKRIYFDFGEAKTAFGHSDVRYPEKILYVHNPDEKTRERIMPYESLTIAGKVVGIIRCL